MNALLLASSALFAWSMGSHYTGSVAGTAYGAGVLSVRTALLLTAVFTVVGSVLGSVKVVATYTTLVPQASTLEITAAQVAALSVTVAATYFKLPTSTIQVYAFSLLGAALVGGASIDARAFGLVVLGWALGPLTAFVVGFGLARVGLRIAARGERPLAWALIGVAVYSAFILGSNDVSNAASSLVAANLLSTRVAVLLGGLFMALGVLTWGRRMLTRIGRDILPLDVPLAATAQLAKAMALSIANGLGYNASINQAIVGGLVGVGTSAEPSRIDRRVTRNIALNWTLSPALGLGAAALVAGILEAVVS